MLCVFRAGGVHRWSAFRKGFVVVVTTIQRFRCRIPPMRGKGRLPRRDRSGNGLVRNRQGVAVRTSACSLIAVHSLFFFDSRESDGQLVSGPADLPVISNDTRALQGWSSDLRQTVWRTLYREGDVTVTPSQNGYRRNTPVGRGNIIHNLSLFSE